jgi:hypothetical protein
MDQNDASDKPIKRVSKQRADGQKSGLAGEFFVAAELLKRGLQTSLTLGNAKSIDLFAINDEGTRFTIQVKALRSPNYFLIDLERVPGRLLLRLCGAKQAGHSARLLHRAGL